MKLSNTIKITIGILTIWPLTYMILFFAIVIGTNVDTNAILPLHIFTMLLCILLYIFYIAHAMKNTNLGKDREIWIILVLLGGIIANIFYWYLHIWKERNKE